MGNEGCKIDIENENKDKIYVGYGTLTMNIFMILFSVFGIIINGIFCYNYLKQMIKSKIKKLSAVENILWRVAVVETIISICWLTNNLALRRPDIMAEKCTICKIVAHIEIFLYLFDWMLLSTSTYQIRIFLLNPKEFLQSSKTVNKFMILSVCFAILSNIISIPADIGGVSPLLTCFINIQSFDKTGQHIFFWIFFTLPIFCFIFAFSQIFLIIRSKEFKEEDKRKFFIKCLYFVVAYIFVSLNLIITYILNYCLIIAGNSPKDSNTYKIYIRIISVICCSAPLFVGVFRSYQTGLFTRLFHKKKSRDIENPLIDINDNQESPIADLENKILDQLIIQYFTAVSYVLGKSKYMKEEEGQRGESLNKSFNAMEHEDYKITKNEILKDMDLKINDDIKVLKEANIDIEITEYNPSTFKQIRELEGLTEDDLISMFQPRKGTSQLIKKKGETIYINSTNKLLMLKEINKEKLMFYQRNILPNLYDHLVNNPKSILCGVFGLFKIKIDQKEDVYMALMYNINESIDALINSNNDNVNQMKIKENELNEYIMIDKNKGNLINNKFKIHLTQEQNIQLKGIIEKDIQFLKEKNIEEFKFLVFERNVEEKERISLMSNDGNNENRARIDPKTKVLNSKVKKYVFVSNLPNIIYTICILDYSRKKLH